MTINYIRTASAALLTIILATAAPGQTTPPDGLRDNTPSVYAFTNARIVHSAGKEIESGTLVIRDGIIESVGSESPPADALVKDLKGLTIYPGLIDAYTHYGLPKPPERQPEGRREGDRDNGSKETGPVYWNGHVRSDRNAADEFSADEKSAAVLRSQGITTVLTVPPRGIFRGTSALVHTGKGTPNELIVRQKVAHHLSFQRDPAVEGYPQSLMGAIAVIRQTLLDADWYAEAWAAYNEDISLPRPEVNAALASLGPALSLELPVFIETSSERDFLRADNIAGEFDLDLIVRGSGHEYKRAEAIRNTGRPVILPLNFPGTPAVKTSEEELDVSLAELRHWDEAPENAGRLHQLGVQIALTSAELKDPSGFLSAVRKAIGRGLDADAALAALTSQPASLLGVDDRLGTLERNKVADFIITDGDLFSDKTMILETWIDGKRYPVNEQPPYDVRGSWSVNMEEQHETATLKLKGTAAKPSGTFSRTRNAKLKNVSVSGGRLSFSFPGDSVGLEGIVRMSAILSPEMMTGSGEKADGTMFRWTATRTEPFLPEKDSTDQDILMASFPPVFPPGAFGRPSLPDRPTAVLVRNATIWTSGPQGILQNTDMLIIEGKIRSVGAGLGAPDGAVIIDGTGKHVTPGLIDAHSHMAGEGALNEAGQAISAEVRIGDVIDPDDIGIYRALAGGLTTAHVMHGSANPIGGQCQVIKLRWGALPEEMKFKGAPPTIKFALGENVKQSNWGDEYTTRYPQTRMGVEQIMRDEFRAALDYEQDWARSTDDASGIPPRRDLELETIVEILRGERFVHCHSYRQDEILATMRVAEDFDFRIRVFQHILEGYKVADIMAQHGAAGSTFSDWWGYKFEVYDAIPYNAALMHNEGVLVSLNSDSDELIRRMNTEASKAVKWGGVSEEEALKFVTINPAIQLRIDDRVGSLETGKDADFAIWNGSPLSTYSLCEQTWLDGRRFFDITEDTALREEVSNQRAVLVQKALATKEKPEKENSRTKRPDEAADDRYSCIETGEDR